MQGRWLAARTPAFCARALARKARTAAHCPLPFTVGDVGFADCATTRSLAGPHSQPKLVRKPRYFRASLLPLSPPLSSEDERARLAWTDRTRKSGETPWGAPLSRRRRRLSGARPPSHSGRSRRGLSVRPKPTGRISVSGQARRRAPRESAAASPDAKRCPDTSHNPRCQRTSIRAIKKPWRFSNRPELFGLIRKVRFASLPDPLSSEG